MARVRAGDRPKKQRTRRVAGWGAGALVVLGQLHLSGERVQVADEALGQLSHPRVGGPREAHDDRRGQVAIGEV